MSRCDNCTSHDADPDIGLCFECFCGPEQPEQKRPEPTDAEYCESNGHTEYEPYGQCYCGTVKYERKGETKL